MVVRIRGLVVLSLSLGCGDDGAGSGGTDTESSTAPTDPTVVSAPSDGPGPGPGSNTEDSTGDPSTSGDPSGDPTTDPTTGGPGPAGVDCDPLPPPEGRTVMLQPGDDLEGAVGSAPTGTTILLADGTYDVSGASFIVFRTPGVTLRSQSGNPENVIIDGGYAIGSILNVAADDVTIAEVTLQRCMWHPIHVTGGPTENTERTTIYRVHIFDPGQQAIKINASAEENYADDGTVACSSVVMTDAGRPNVSACYTGGIDGHLARGWHVRDNYFEGFWCPDGLSEHAVHFWNSGRDTVVERNVIVDCARGIGFGLGENGNGTSRDYGDDPCPGAGFVGHYDGVIRNNTVLGARAELFASSFGFDSGIALEQACGTVVEHNTVVALQQPFTSMEYRFSNTDAAIHNNLVTHDIMMRDGGQADLQGNITSAALDHFVDAAGGNVHLAPDSTAIDAAVGSSVEDDIDGDDRDGSPDVGADEYVP